MKLTKSAREAFVNAVMQDVPRRDFNTETHSVVQAFFRPMLPLRVIELLDTDPGWLETRYVQTPTHLPSVHVVAPEELYSLDKYPELRTKLLALAEEAKAQNESRTHIRHQLEVAIGACSTLKQAKERLPEFEKYLPAERDPAGLKNAPVIANLVADLTKAGWPKAA